MRLSAFLLLLKGQLFIPSLATLRRSDPFESRVPYELLNERGLSYEPFEGEVAWSWLKERMPDWEKEFVGGETPFHAVSNHFVRTWLNELAHRRCIWCWYGQDAESITQWQIYGSQGVMIQSTPDKVRSALEPIFKPDEKTSHSVGRVMYHTVNAHGLLDDLTIPPLLIRPYYVKEHSYRHEHEVRFVSGVNPDLCNVAQQGGVLVKVRPEVLIQRATIAPQVLGSEAETLIEIFRSLQQNLNVERSRLAGLASEQRGELEKAFSDHLDRPFHLGTQEFEDAAPVLPPPPGLFDDV